ncbi:hypothetical protein HHI36_024433 [Cryptolaemus montrouzieri]|uniref:Uncharacterized protein n=1 Tax=Cryptolaemus montrouzieri TaxID=559131 RepID=A0ABD2MWA9_9CUCU
MTKPKNKAGGSNPPAAPSSKVSKTTAIPSANPKTSPKKNLPTPIDENFKIVTRSRRPSSSSKASTTGTISPMPALSSSTPSASQSSSRSSSPNGSTHSQIKKPTIKYVIRNIPNQFSSQRDLYRLLRPTALNITQLKANFNKTALVECSNPAPPNFQKTLQDLVGTPSISFEPLRKGNSSYPRTKTPQKDIILLCRQIHPTRLLYGGN